jgi:ABC-type amino acid transport substrate-binding protein
LPEVYVQNASLEIAWSRVVFEERTIAGNVIVPFMTESSEGFDVNSEYDWHLAEHMVEKGEANAFLTDFPICLSVMKRHPDRGFQSVVSLLTYEPIGIALPANDPLLINLARNFIDRAENVGLMQGLALKWFGQAKLSVISE